MDSKNLQLTFIEQLNKILPTLDYVKLDQSCNSVDTAASSNEIGLFYTLQVRRYKHLIC